MGSTIAVYPSWDSIVERCKKKMAAKYEKRGNSWVNASTTQLMDRIRAEFTELEAVIAEGEGEARLIEEAHDLVNQLGMLITAETWRWGDEDFTEDKVDDQPARPDYDGDDDSTQRRDEPCPV